MSSIESSNNIILASKSPRRKILLEQIGLKPHVIAVDVPEINNNEQPEAYVKRLAHDKALAGWQAFKANADTNDTTPVLGADTIVVLGDQVLEKPKSHEDAQAMLAMLSNNTHRVITAVAVCHAGQVDGISVVSHVTFRSISSQEADRYIATQEPMDKAGGYGIQGLGAIFVENIEGSYSNVVGLPLFETAALLSRLNVSGF